MGVVLIGFGIVDVQQLIVGEIWMWQDIVEVVLVVVGYCGYVVDGGVGVGGGVDVFECVVFFVDQQVVVRQEVYCLWFVEGVDGGSGEWLVCFFDCRCGGCIGGYVGGGEQGGGKVDGE